MPKLQKRRKGEIDIQGKYINRKSLFQQELLERLNWFIKLRWLSIIGVLLAVWIVSNFLGIIIKPLPLYIIAASMAFYNTLFFFYAKRIYPMRNATTLIKDGNRFANIQISMDLVALTFLCHFSGGIENPFIFYFIFHMIIASILLYPKAAFIQATLAVLLSGSMVALEYTQMVSHIHLRGFLPENIYREPFYVLGVLFVFITVLYMSIYMTTSISRKLKEREYEISSAKEYTDNILHSMNDVLVVVSPDNNIKIVNPAACALLGYEEKELIGQPIGKIFGREKLWPKGLSFADLAEKGVVHNVEKTYLSKEGKKIPVLFSSSPMHDYNDEIQGIVCVAQHLTERKQVEEELRYALDKLRKALGGIIQAMALTVETRDPYTAGHQRHVANLARAIADEMDLSESQIDGIRMAGAIHDIGKISVPVDILSKPGEISDIEFSLIKTHPEVGYNILKKIDFPWPIAQIVIQHHERLDGSGYPLGLSGEEILLEARILAVADVVEAMASHRPYRPAPGIDKALEEISRNKGILYDPRVVDACLKLFNEKGFSLE